MDGKSSRQEDLQYKHYLRRPKVPTRKTRPLKYPTKKSDKRTMRTLAILAILATAACSTPARGPAAATSPGGLNAEEQKACDEADGECRYIIAPCSLKEHSPLYRAPGNTEPQKYMSLKQEAYLNELEDLPKRGYCQLPPRPLPAELYNKDTCIYVFVKNGTCKAG